MKFYAGQRVKIVNHAPYGDLVYFHGLTGVVTDVEENLVHVRWDHSVNGHYPFDFQVSAVFKWRLMQLEDDSSDKRVLDYIRSELCAS